jgi:hypothetical protein
VEDCRFVVTGPSQSGKSTLLSIAVSLFFQKLQLASETLNYLIVPFNWYLHQIYLDDQQKLYGLIVATTLNALRAARVELIPVIAVLHQWFLSILTIPGLPPLPRSVAHFPKFPQAVVFDIGKKIHASWHRKEGNAETGGKEELSGKTTTLPRKDEKEPFQLFLIEIVKLPLNLAAAFGFKTAVLVFDHFDAAAYEIEPGEHFTTSRSPVNLFSILWQSIQGSPFFVSSQDDEELLKLFRREKGEDYKQLSTERLIVHKGERELIVPQLQIHVSIDMCRGCPAYCAMFERVCDMAAEAQERAAVKSQFSRLKSVVDISRNLMLKQEFIRLCLLLAAADTDGRFHEDKMNQMMALQDFNVRVRRTSQKEEADAEKVEA